MNSIDNLNIKHEQVAYTIIEDKRIILKPKIGQVVYVEINGWTYFIDDTTGEQIMTKWENDMWTEEKDKKKIILSVSIN